MAKKNKELKKIKKSNLIKVKNNEEQNNNNLLLDFNIVNVTPAEIKLPEKYYTAKMEQDGEVDYLSKDDILIIDSTVKTVRNSGIYLFEFRGHILVRQFQTLPFENKYKAVGKTKSSENEYYPKDEVSVIGAIIGKHVELFPSLYHNNPLYRAYGAVNNG